MRRAWLLIVVLALGVASCGGSSSDRSRSTGASSPGPTGPSGSASAGEAQSRGASGADGVSKARARSEGKAFDRSTVKVSFINTSHPFGVKSAVVYFIAQGPSRGWLGQARACARRYLDKAPSAYCFAFSTERAFRYSGVARRPPAKMKRPCWSVYWGEPKGRRPISASSNPSALPLHCPDAGGSSR
jgi:hypothetical protein